MGSSQSQPAEGTHPEVVRINRDEVPEEYKAVGVSNTVVTRVNQQTGAPRGTGIAADIDVNKLKSELDKERQEKQQLRSEMARLSELQQRALSGAPVVLAADDIEERKKVFEETVERVQKQFFNYQRENVCQDNEKEIMDCLRANPNRVLKCSNLVGAYEKCVADFRQEVLKGN